MTLALAQTAISLLIELAERGEIDPWDVKVIEVIDRFLSKLQPTRVESASPSGRSPYEADLSESGQAFLYASMLLLLKADSLARQEQAAEETDDNLDEFAIDPAFNHAPLPPNLERKIRRRAVAPPVSNRRVTLQELIDQLNWIATAMTEQQPRRLKNRRPRPQPRSQAIRTIAQLAHQENLTEIAAILEQFLQAYWQDHQEWLEFETLLERWAESQDGADEPAPAAPPQVTVHDRVGVFWALLFLSAQSKVELEQQEFYVDLKVRQLDPQELAPSNTTPNTTPNAASNTTATAEDNAQPPESPAADLSAAILPD